MELGAQGLDSALLGEQLAHVAAKIFVGIRGAGMMQNLTENPEQRFLDLALVYALMNFIGTIAVMKFTRFGDLAGMEDDEEDTF